MTNERPPAAGDELEREIPGASGGVARIAIGTVAFLAVGAMFFGPNTLRSYHEAQDIKHKAGPASEYVRQVLAKITLDGRRTHVEVGEHTCSRGPKYWMGNEAWHCGVKGDAAYVLNGKFPNYSEAYSYALETLRNDGIEAGPQSRGATAVVDGQKLGVGASVGLTDAITYNHQSPIERSPDGPASLPVGGYMATVYVAASTVEYNPPDYPYNNESK
jgi:hypothetical protein